MLHASIQTFQQAKEAAYFFSDWRSLYPVSREDLHDIANQFKNWITNRSLTWEVPILEPPAKRRDDFRRDDFVTPYFQSAKPDQIVAILKAREPATILVSMGKKTTGCHLELKWRWVEQYYFYLNDRDFGRMFVGVCPYFPFPAWVCLNQHHWLANRMRDRGIRFKQCANAFLSCSDPDQLQLLADSLEPRHVIACGQKWLARLIPFFTEKERAHGRCQHRLFFSQVEYCDNLIFRRRFALDRLMERLLDANRTIGRPDKVTIIFGRKVSKRHTGKLQTEIEDLHLGNPVIRACYKKNVAKQYVRDHSLLRTEASTYNVKELRLRKAVDNLPKLHDTLQAITQNYLNVQQDILETFVDRGQIRHLSQPTVTPSGKRIPGLKIDHPRQLALMQALVRFCHVAAQGTFATSDVHPQVAEALGFSTEEYKLGSLRYDLSKLRAKGLVEKLPHSRRYRLLPEGYRLCLVYLKLFEKIYAPLTAGVSKPFAGDTRHPPEELSRLDKLYRAVVTALDNLVEAVGLKAA